MDSCLTHVFIFILFTFGITIANTSIESKTGTLSGKVYEAALN